MELPAVTVLASKNVNAGAAGAGLVLAAEQRRAVCGCAAAEGAILVIYKIIFFQIIFSIQTISI